MRLTSGSFFRLSTCLWLLGFHLVALQPLGFLLGTEQGNDLEVNPVASQPPAHLGCKMEGDSSRAPTDVICTGCLPGAHSRGHLASTHARSSWPCGWGL